MKEVIVSPGGMKKLREDVEQHRADMAIVANGNTHVAIGAGQFVDVKSHPTLADGVYRNKLTTAIDADAALSTENLESVSSGALNALKAEVTAALDTKQGALTFDNTPASGSDNPVKSSGVYSAIHSLNTSDITSGTLPVANGGTGAATAADARTNLGITPANIGAVPAAGGTMTGTLRIAKSTDASGTSYTGPALVVGGNPDGAHIEIDNNEIIAKTDETTGTTLSLNFEGGGSVNLAAGSLIAHPTDGVTLKKALSIDNGGTGKKTAVDAANQFINALGLGDNAPTDDDYVITQYVGGGETNKTYYRRKMSMLWNYIKSKFMPSGYVPISNGGTGAATASTARTNLGVNIVFKIVSLSYDVGAGLNYVVSTQFSTGEYVIAFTYSNSSDPLVHVRQRFDTNQNKSDGFVVINKGSAAISGTIIAITMTAPSELWASNIN